MTKKELARLHNIAALFGYRLGGLLTGSAIVLTSWVMGASAMALLIAAFMIETDED